MAEEWDQTERPSRGEILEMWQLRERFRQMFPEEFFRHLTAARKEFWLAIRSLIDARIAALERQERARGAEQAPVE